MSQLTVGKGDEAITLQVSKKTLMRLDDQAFRSKKTREAVAENDPEVQAAATAAREARAARALNRKKATASATESVDLAGTDEVAGPSDFDEEVLEDPDLDDLREF